MLWLQRPPWARWIGAGLLVAIAVWVELGPDPSIAHPFATTEIAPGEAIDASNTEMRQVPIGIFEPVELGERVTGVVGFGEPILRSHVSTARTAVPPGWWVVSIGLPVGSRVGDQVHVVILDTGAAVPGIVVTEGFSDPFDSAFGAVAVGPDRAAEVARAVADGKAAVLLSAG